MYNVTMKKTFANLIKEKIGDTPIHKAAKQYGLSHTTLYKAINGEMDDPSPLIAARLCDSLNIDLKEIEKLSFNPNKEYLNELSQKFLEIKDVSNNKKMNSLYNQFNQILKDNGYNEINTPTLIRFSKSESTTIKAFITENKKSKKKCLIYELPPRKIEETSFVHYPDHNMRDYTNILLSILSNRWYDLMIRSGNISKQSNEASLWKIFPDEIIQDHIILTSSKRLFDEILKFPMGNRINLNIQLIYCQYNNQPESKMIAGSEIIKL